MLILYFSLLIIGLFIVHRTCGISNVLNPYVMFMLYQAVFLYSGALISLFDLYSVSVSDYVVSVVVFGFCLCFLYGAIFVFFIKMSGFSYPRIEDVEIVGFLNRKHVLSAFVIWSFGVFLWLYFISSTGFIALLESNIEVGRIDAVKGYGKIVVFCQAFITLGAVILISSQSLSLWGKVFILVFSVFMLLTFGSRLPVLKLFLILIVIYWVVKGYKVDLKKLALLGGCLFIAMIVLGALRAEVDSDLSEVIMARFFWRPFVTVHNFSLIVDRFSDLLYGESILIELKTLLPGYSPNFGTWVKEQLGLTFAGGSVTSSYLGVAYINFGTVGYIVYPFFYIVFYNLIYVCLVKEKMTISNFVFLTMMSFSLMGGSIVGLLTPVLYNGIPVAVVFLVYRFVLTMVGNVSIGRL